MKVPTKKKPAGAGAKAESSSESSEEQSSSDEDRKAKGVEGLIEIEVCFQVLTIFIRRCNFCRYYAIGYLANLVICYVIRILTWGHKDRRK